MKRNLNTSASILALVCCSAAYAQTAKADGAVETVVVTIRRGDPFRIDAEKSVSPGRAVTKPSVAAPRDSKSPVDPTTH